MGNNGNGREKEILDLINKENSWEQIIYQVVALQDLDPWNLDLNALASGFADHIAALEELDFRVPAKWVIIAAVLLRMKSDYIKIMKMDEGPGEEEFMDLEGLGDLEDDGAGEPALDVDPIEAAPRRKPVRRVTITELVDSLKRVLTSERRREMKIRKRRGHVNIITEDITARIENLYARISDMLGTMKEDRLRFSNLVGSWERGNVVDTFLPLIHLENEKKVLCTQKRMFDEIFIKRRDAPS